MEDWWVFIKDWYSVSEMLRQILKSGFQLPEPVPEPGIELSGRVPANPCTRKPSTCNLTCNLNLINPAPIEAL